MWHASVLLHLSPKEQLAATAIWMLELQLRGRKIFASSSRPVVTNMQSPARHVPGVYAVGGHLRRDCRARMQERRNVYPRDCGRS